MEITIGSKQEMTKQVTGEMTAEHFGSGDLSVLATPMMVTWFEQCSAECLKKFLDDGLTSVGIYLEAEHISATPVGATVSVKAELTAVDNKIITFCATAYDEAGEIGHCIHKRAIVTSERFLEKTYSKIR